MAIGNTGLAQYGDRMILAQEYVSADPLENVADPHNPHGPINSRNVVLVDGEPDLEEPHTNVYAARGSDFILVNVITKYVWCRSGRQIVACPGGSRHSSTVEFLRRDA